MRRHALALLLLATACAGGSGTATTAADPSAVSSLDPGSTSVSAPPTSDGSGSASTGSGSSTGTDDGSGSGTDTSTGAAAPDLPSEPAGACRDLLAWSETEAFADDVHVSHPLPSFARAGFYYVHTMRQEDASERRLLFAALGPDGAPGPWQEAAPDHGGGPHGYTAIVADGQAYHFRNGHIAHYVFAADGTMVGDVELLEDSPDTAFGGNKYVWDTAVAMPLPMGHHVLHLGGFSFTGYTYRPDVYRSPVPLAASFSDTGLDHPSGQRPGKSVFYAPPGVAGGHVFTGRGDGPELWRGDIDPGGALLGWTQLPNLPDGTDNQRGDLFVAGRTLFTVRGAAVLRADLDLTGELGAWTGVASLPGPQVDMHWGEGHLEGAAYAVVDEHVYLTGPRRVYFAALMGRPCDG
ncbi:hypothetical protein [Nannocystis sp.]|uniref:hypothetical protein n=1 Tax=Nannocystis sp. TaxID=1962667 RepID=UPI0025D3BF12|nr:hypothetical protein [Nannocystis sp.]MBK7824382.1 hypothetical protein [Nannocystis sp.]